MSRTAHPAAAMPSPVTPIDAASQLLLRPGLIGTTCHSVVSCGVVTQSSALVNCRSQLAGSASVVTSMVPLGVVVSSDSVATAANLGKVRQMSPEIAKTLLQQQTGRCTVFRVHSSYCIQCSFYTIFLSVENWMQTLVCM